uniref:NADH-ubiquinone oxidoreductase chain 4 n=1 Tax=Ornithodoros sonrai TaxID=352064 RepID=A0A3G2K006_9ACAR|nr:NADH dehydrogenase subunit 4 [Ornithodoros sonrai]AYN50619.1 NADH dehydrogenase subunit 4 [Ornithodoros sonrai]
MMIMGVLMIIVYFYMFSFIEIIFIFLSLIVFLFFKMDWLSVWVYISELFSIDLMGFMLMELSLLVAVLMYLASMNLNINNESMFSFYISILTFFLLFCFSLSNLMGFYLFFESVLFPIILMIMGWGYQPERLQAGLYMLFYTLLGSLPLLLFFLLKKFNLSFVYIYWVVNSNTSIGVLMFLMGVMAFFVKMPMYLVHTWLPKAHVEAPIAGSMILAGVLLKLGIYGMFRVSSFMLIEMLDFSFLVMSVVMVGGVIVSMICLCQVDISALIAYSSVCHMGLALGGIFSMNSWGSYGNLLMMLGHGLCSSGLFCLANMYYERVFTRSMLLLKGVGGFFPFMGVWWFIFSVVNMAAPPSMNLGGEIFLIGSLLKWSLLLIIPLGMMSFLSAAYCLYMFSYLHHGSGWVNYSLFSMSLREQLLMIVHFFPLIVWILKMEMFVVWT